MESIMERKETKVERTKRIVKVKVVPTEIYSRVVGYYRPVQNWNKGKTEEFKHRASIDPNHPVKKRIEI
jgi:anaerobic ribonucleoside-triphosphate reductase